MIILTFHQRSSLHFTTLHSPFFTSLHFLTFRHHHASKTLPFSSLSITLLAFFQKMYDLQWQSLTPLQAVGTTVWLSHWQRSIYRSVLCFLTLILRSWSSLFKWYGPCNLSPVTFHSLSPGYDLKGTQMWAIILRCAKVSQTESFVWFANLVVFFCTQFKSVYPTFPVRIPARSPIFKNRTH